MTSSHLIILLAASYITHGEPSDLLTQEMSKLQGTWKLVTGQRGGDPDVDKKGSVTFEKDNVTIRPKAPEEEFIATYKLKVEQNPKQIDILLLAGANKGKS